MNSASPYDVVCDDYDDDTVYTEATCGPKDNDFCKVKATDDVKCIDHGNACYYGAENGTAFTSWCGTACEGSWGAYCLWEAWANLDLLCNGTFVPTAPARRLTDDDLGRSCAFHARCETCSGKEKKYCTAVYQKYYYWDALLYPSYSGNEEAAAALEPVVLKTWCAEYDFTYMPKVLA